MTELDTRGTANEVQPFFMCAVFDGGGGRSRPATKQHVAPRRELRCGPACTHAFALSISGPASGRGRREA